MTNIVYKLFLVSITVILTVGCASSKKEKIPSSDSNGKSTLDESFDPLSLNDDDIKFEEPETRVTDESPRYLPEVQPAQDSTVSLPNELVEGFRIQILSTKDLENATRAKSIAMEQFSDIQVKFYLEFDSPYYKVRLGDFIKRNDAEETREVVRSRGYPKAWIVKTKIWSNPEFPVPEDSTEIDTPEFD
jgi:hypothetical protein